MHNQYLMRKIILITIVLFLTLTKSQAQESRAMEVIVLKNGEKIEGRIANRTTNSLTIDTYDNKRFQFQLSEIERIDTTTPKIKQPSDARSERKTDFAGLAEINGGVSKSASANLSVSPTISVSLAFGTLHAIGSKSFLGIGAGYETVFRSERNHTLGSVPIFLVAQIPFTGSKISPFVRSKAGYALRTEGNYDGGFFVGLTTGAILPLSSKTALSVGIFGKTEQIVGTVVESNEFGNYITQGKTQLPSWGLSFGLIF